MNIYGKDHESGECDCPVCHYKDEILWNDEDCDPACDQCQIVTINGASCHETGCPNSWIDPVKQKAYPVDCCECGFSYVPISKPSKYSICPECTDPYTYWDDDDLDDDLWDEDHL